MTFATCLQPRQVFNVIDHAHRDMAVAEDVVGGRFTCGGVTLDLGPSPHWSDDPYPPDKEWQIEWVKFYYGLDLAHAWGETGDDRYWRAWVGLIDSFVTQRTPGSDDTEVAARRVQNWIYAWNRFAAHGASMDPDLSARVVAFLWDEVAFVRDNLTRERNHRTLELYTLLMASLAFPELDPGASLRIMAFDQLHANLLEDVRPDGVHREASTHYHCIALRSWLGALHHARQLGVGLPASYLARVQAACEFAAHAHRPDGNIPAFSDADAESYLDVLMLAATLFDRADWRWVATRGRSGSPPVRCHVSFDDGGYHVQRSGWGREGARYDDERFLMFDCGPLGDGGHGHYDFLSVEIFAHGRPLLVDPGRYTYSESGENWRRWFKGTAAHNTVSIDGLDQMSYSRRKPKGPRAEASLLWRSGAPGLDVMCGKTVSPLYEVVHVRTVAFVAGEYWIVIDDLVGRRLHHYALRWHCAPAEPHRWRESSELRARPPLSDGEVVLRELPNRAEVPGAVLTFAPARSLRVEPGWYAPTYGVKRPAPTVVVEAHAQSTTFATLIDPRPADPNRPPLEMNFLSRGGRCEGAVTVEVRGIGDSGEGRDLITWAPADGFVDLDRFRGVARAAWLRRGTDGQTVDFAASDVGHATWRETAGHTSIRPVTSGSWITWSAARGALSVGRT